MEYRKQLMRKLRRGACLGLIFSALHCSDSKLQRLPDQPTTWSHRVRFCAETTPGLSALDVMLAVDTTGSMGAAINNLQNNLVDLVSAIQGLEPRTRFGVGHFEDFPTYAGSNGSVDKAWELFQPLTFDMNDVEDAIDALTYVDASGTERPIGWGGDGPESYVEAVYQGVTGEGLDANNDGDYTDEDDILPSSPGWAESEYASRVLVLVGDAPFRDPDRYTGASYDPHAAPAGAHGLTEATTAAFVQGIRVVGIAVRAYDGTNPTLPYMEEMANLTNAISVDGYDGNEDGDTNDAMDLEPGSPLIFETTSNGTPVGAGGSDIGQAIGAILQEILTTNMWVELSGRDAEEIRMIASPEVHEDVLFGQEVCFDVTFSGDLPPDAGPTGYEVTLAIRLQTGEIIRSEDLTIQARE